MLIFHTDSQCLNVPYDDIEMSKSHADSYKDKLDEILYTFDDKESGYFLEVDLKYPDEIKEKTKLFPLAPENEQY